MQTAHEIIEDLTRRLLALERATDSNPVGTFLVGGGDTTAPNGYLQCEGQAVSRSTYRALFAVLGTKYGAGDGTSTFNLPPGVGAVLMGVALATTTRATTVTTSAQSADHSHSGTTSGHSADHSHSGTTSTVSSDHTHGFTTGGVSAGHTHTHSAVYPTSGGNATAPVVQGVLLIKT